jgi:MFS family permease
MVAMVQLSIALGSTVGGLLFDHHGYQSTFLASAAMLIIATVLIFLTSRADHFCRRPFKTRSNAMTVKAYGAHAGTAAGADGYHPSRPRCP